MTKKLKILIGVVAVAALGGIVAVSVKSGQKGGTEVKTEKVEKRDLTAVVTASGKIRPKLKGGHLRRRHGTRDRAGRGRGRPRRER